METGGCCRRRHVPLVYWFGDQSQQTPVVNMSSRISFVFFGRPNDREALDLGGRTAEHPAVKVTVVRFRARDAFKSNKVMLKPFKQKSAEDSHTFSTVIMIGESERELDEAVLAKFQGKWTGVANNLEKVANSIESEVLAEASSRHYDLMVVGKGRFPSAMVTELADQQAEQAELGPTADMLASSANDVDSSVLVIQQYDYDPIEEIPVSKVLDQASDKGIQEMMIQREQDSD